jgi:hypothetical protein
MSEASNNRQLFLLIGGGALVLFILYRIDESQKNNQFVRPIPDSQPAPVVPELPDLMANLDMIRMRAESQAGEAKRFAAQGRIRGGELAKGRGYYDRVRENTNATITYMQTALHRRFIPADVDAIQSRIRDTAQALSTFGTWYARFSQPDVGATDPLKELLDALNAWLNGIPNQNQKVIDAMDRKLQSLRLRDWNEIP